MSIAFSVDKKGLRVSLNILDVSEVPGGSTLNWDFGDTSVLVTSDPEPIEHIYSNVGIYIIRLVVTDTNSEVLSDFSKAIVVSALTSLSGSIYDLIDNYIPDILKIEFQEVKQSFIEKWQFYFQPLVIHFIPIEEFNNESCYEALENQLIMEMAAYDYLIIELNKAIANLAVISSTEADGDSETTGSSEGNIKKIKTGPTEVEYHDKYDSASKIVKTLSGSRGGASGVLVTLKTNIMLLAHRLDIHLPIGGASDKMPIIPKLLKGF